MFLSLQEIVRGGVTVSVNLNYKLLPEATIAVCYINLPITFEKCVTVHDEWPENRIGIEAWYQIRSVKWCRTGWLGISYVSVCVCTHLIRDLLLQGSCIWCKSCKGSSVDYIS